MTEENQKQMETKERILAKSEELFMRYGIRSITMDDIARELAVSKKTIYQHFKDKDELVYQMGLRHFECDKEEWNKMTNCCENAVDIMVTMSKHLKNTLKGINPSLFFDLQRYHPDTWDLWQNHKKTFIIETIKKNMEQGIAEGLYRDDVNVETLAILRVKEIELAFDMDTFPPQKFDLLNVQITFLEHFIRGIVTAKGYAVLEDLFAKNQNIFQNP